MLQGILGKTRVGWLVLGLAVACGLLAGASTAAPGPARRSAVVRGYVQLCGGPAPGRCRKEGRIGFCQAPRGCVTTHRVAAVDARGRRVAVQRLRHARFSFRLRPGHYTIQLLGDGRRVRGQVMQTKKVWARSDHASVVRFRFDVP